MVLIIGECHPPGDQHEDQRDDHDAVPHDEQDDHGADDADHLITW